jgi:hypothetical protein
VKTTRSAGGTQVTVNFEDAIRADRGRVEGVKT